MVELSVALVTRNRPAALEKCLVSLRTQNVQPFEVIISDDSDPEYAPCVKALAFAYACRYLKGPHLGLYANRNFVALECRGTHIRTMDDDHLLPVDHLDLCIQAVAKDPAAVWTIGEKGFVGDRYVGTAERASQLGPTGLGQMALDPDDNWAIADGSTIYPREIFVRGFRMVESFGFGSAYLEFGALLYRNGWKSRCIPDALVEHRADVLSPPDPVSQRFASICFNRYFKPNFCYLLRHTLPDRRRWAVLPKLFAMARERWKRYQ